MYLSGLKKDYDGKRCAFNEERNEGKVGQDQSGRAREFQMDGAANEKERRPFAERISGTVRSNLSGDFRFLVGTLAAYFLEIAVYFFDEGGGGGNSHHRADLYIQA